LKSIVAQHENLAAKGIFGVRAPLRFFCSFRLNKDNTRNFFTDNSWTNFEDFDIKVIIITPSESILSFSWIITNFQEHACFEQFVWAWYNIFASFFALDVMFRTVLSFACVYFVVTGHFMPLWGLSILRANLASIEKSAAGKVGLLTLPRCSQTISLRFDGDVTTFIQP